MGVPSTSLTGACVSTASRVSFSCASLETLRLASLARLASCVAPWSRAAIEAEPPLQALSESAAPARRAATPAQLKVFSMIQLPSRSGPDGLEQTKNENRPFVQRLVKR